MIKEQFQASYKLLKKHLKDIDEDKATFQPSVANNNIKWQLGHFNFVK
ncbi:DinB family protein [Staphylococcus shinii]|nr:DinB family protein [Staphylococcus shinii]MDW8570484.1 DinB family protein [Staphylococcus shinii]MDW8573612.1 DinB family protein [Staphylococcus shinii]